MIFPIAELLSHHESVAWIETHFHPQGLQCPDCAATPQQARQFRVYQRGVVDYRCQHCDRVYNLYTGTIFEGSRLDTRQVVLLLRGVCKGEPSAALAVELSLSRRTVHQWRKKLQANAYRMLSHTSLPNEETETDEMFQNAGEKRGMPR